MLLYVGFNVMPKAKLSVALNGLKRNLFKLKSKHNIDFAVCLVTPKGCISQIASPSLADLFQTHCSKEVVFSVYTLSKKALQEDVFSQSQQDYDSDSFSTPELRSVVSLAVNSAETDRKHKYPFNPATINNAAVAGTAEEVGRAFRARHSWWKEEVPWKKISRLSREDVSLILRAFFAEASDGQKKAVFSKLKVGACLLKANQLKILQSAFFSTPSIHSDALPLVTIDSKQYGGWQLTRDQCKLLQEERKPTRKRSTTKIDGQVVELHLLYNAAHELYYRKGKGRKWGESMGGFLRELLVACDLAASEEATTKVLRNRLREVLFADILPMSAVAQEGFDAGTLPLPNSFSPSPKESPSSKDRTCEERVKHPSNNRQQAPLLLGKESSSEEGGSVADGEESNEDSELSESEFESTGSSNRDSLLHGGSPSPSVEYVPRAYQQLYQEVPMAGDRALKLNEIGSRADLTSKGSIIKSAKYFLEKGQIVCDEKRVPSYTRNPAVAGLIEDFSPIAQPTNIKGCAIFLPQPLLQSSWTRQH